MATLLKCGGLFLHVPKTGGNWISGVLESQRLVFAHVGGKHAGLAQLEPLQRLLHTPQRYARSNRPLFTFCFVRHPLRWYESWYRMGIELDWPDWDSADDVWNPSVELNGLKPRTFNHFIEGVLRTRPGFLTRMYAHYADGSHYVGRQERMAVDLIAVLKLLHVQVDAARLLRTNPVNVSARADVSLDPSLRRALEDAERDAYCRFGYDSNGLSQAGDPSSTPAEPFSLFRVAMPIAHDEGHCWRIPVPQYSRFSDDEQHPTRSLLWLFEDGAPLAAAHAVHAGIRLRGLGRFSHWKESLFFSTSDNSDPRVNGRRYDAGWFYPSSADATTLLFDPSATPHIEACQ
jgi:hypothetical protein